MKENIYDNNRFFDKYSHFPRSVAGLSAAGEWHELKKMLPDFQGKAVLDIGCGFGWHCTYAAERCAETVIGTDISTKMLAGARERTHLANIEYQQIAMEDLDFKPESFDIIISSLALHYTPDFDRICSKISSFLRVNGEFIFSVEHPVFTAYGNQDWIYNEDGTPDHWPVDNYFLENQRKAVFLGETVTKYHKTLTTYLNTLIKHGLSITAIVEPIPDKHLLDSVPGMKDELRRPMMLLVSAKKIK